MFTSGLYAVAVLPIRLRLVFDAEACAQHARIEHGGGHPVPSGQRAGSWVNIRLASGPCRRPADSRCQRPATAFSTAEKLIRSCSRRTDGA